VLGVDGVNAVGTVVATSLEEQHFDVAFDRFHSGAPQWHWVVPQSADAPLITGHPNDPVLELPLRAGGIYATTDLDGDLVAETVRIDSTGTLQFIDMTTGVVGEMALPPEGQLRLDLGISSVIDHNADLCAKPRPLPSRGGFAVATTSGLVVYRPTCSVP
jgi:hypothetical protein